MSSFPWGKLRTTAAALEVGVRMSYPPLRASTGTSGSGPAPSGGVGTAGVGHLRQNAAVPSLVAHEPNGPSDPAGSALIAADSFPGRSASGAAGSHGKCPSAQDVAALSPTLSCSAEYDEPPRS